MAKSQPLIRLKITQPIEVEMDEWLTYMIGNLRIVQQRTIWGKRKREFEMYINAYERVRTHLRKELAMFPVSERWKQEED